jgi:SAM-dependent methyltransferase
VITILEHHGFLKQLRDEQKINLQDIKSPIHLPTLTSLLNYLSKLNLLSQSGNTYQTTGLGNKVFARSGGFLIMHSYHQYMENISYLLKGEPNVSPKVDRVENIIGSALIHKKKYFECVTNLLKGQNFDSLIDIACGAGEFLQFMQASYPEISIAGLDLSEQAIQMSKKNLPTKTPLVVSNGLSIHQWLPQIQSAIGEFPIFSMWFFLHEIFAIGVVQVAQFFIQLKSAYPNSRVLVGEIVKLPIQDFFPHHSESINPEFLLFHELSGQCVPSWGQYQDLLKKIPYRISKQLLYDEVEGIPSSFIWSLE